jgi:hypothetical protein
MAEEFAHLTQADQHIAERPGMLFLLPLPLPVGAGGALAMNESAVSL